jgi:hypothetical protein
MIHRIVCASRVLVIFGKWGARMRVEMEGNNWWMGGRPLKKIFVSTQSRLDKVNRHKNSGIQGQIGRMEGLWV